MELEATTKKVVTTIDDKVKVYRVVNEFRLQSPCVECPKLNNDNPDCRIDCEELNNFKLKHRNEMFIDRSAMAYAPAVSSLPVPSERLLDLGNKIGKEQKC